MRFTSDWFSLHIPNWQRWLAPLVGKQIEALEIGSYEGRSALWLLDNVLTHEGARLTCIDPFSYEGAPPGSRPDPHLQEAEANFLANTQQARAAGRLLFHKCHSLEFLRSCQARYSLVYVDGCHHPSSTLADMILAWHLLTPGGIMIADDYLWTLAPQRPKEAIDAFLLCFEGQYTQLEKGYQVCFTKQSQA